MHSSGYFKRLFLALALVAFFCVRSRADRMAMGLADAGPAVPPGFTGIDLDGDHLPDAAVSRWDGTSRRIEVSLSSLRRKISLTFASSCPDIVVYACDVDRDNDADLVVARAGSLEPLAVWINEHNGSFRRADPWWCSGLDLGERPAAAHRVVFGVRTIVSHPPDGWIADHSLSGLNPGRAEMSQAAPLGFVRFLEAAAKPAPGHRSSSARSPPPSLPS